MTSDDHVQHDGHGHDPTFYPSPRDAAAGPPEKLAYVAAFDRSADKPDAIAVVDVDPASSSYGSVVGFTELPHTGDELHHFGWNACCSALCPTGDHTHVDRRYLVVPGLRSSRIYILDTKDDPATPQVTKVLEPDELGKRAGYSRPHTVHCGPRLPVRLRLGGADGEDGPGGIALLDHDDLRRARPVGGDRGAQYLAYDVWWHIKHDVLVTSEWGTPSMIEDGVVPELLLGRKYGHRLHFWDLRTRKHLQTVDLGDEHQMVLELRPAHDPTKTYGFVGVVVSVEDLSASIWLWHQDNGEWAATKVISIPAEPAPAEQLPPLLQPFGAVPPLVTDIDLSVDDQYLYVSCWGTGELKQYDVTRPVPPGRDRLGADRRHRRPQAAPVRAGRAAGRRPADGRGQPRRQARVRHQLAVRRLGRPVLPRRRRRLDGQARRRRGRRLSFDERFFLEGDDFRGLRVHQIRLAGRRRLLRLLLLLVTEGSAPPRSSQLRTVRRCYSSGGERPSPLSYSLDALQVRRGSRRCVTEGSSARHDRSCDERNGRYWTRDSGRRLAGEYRLGTTASAPAVRAGRARASRPFVPCCAGKPWPAIPP